MAVDGTYDVEVKSPMGKFDARVTIKTDGDSLSGTMDSQMGKSDFTGGTINGNDVAWDMDVQSPLGKMKLQLRGTINGDDVSGEVKIGNFGTSPFAGRRI